MASLSLFFLLLLPAVKQAGSTVGMLRHPGDGSASRYNYLPPNSTPTIDAELVAQHLVILLVSHSVSEHARSLHPGSDALVNHEGDGLSRGDSHDSRGDTLVEGVEAFLLEHVCGDGGDAGHGGLAWLGWRLLETGLDGVDWSVGEWAHGSGDETEEHVLVGWEVFVLWLEAGGDGLHFGVGSEVD